MTRHRAKRHTRLLISLATAAAVGWATIGLPSWAGQSASSSRAQATLAAPPVACDQQDTEEKGWYQAVYVHRAGQPARPGAADHIRQVLSNIDQVFEASARRFGQQDSRRPRLMQDPSCRPTVTVLPVAGLPATLPDFAASHQAADAAIAAQFARLTGAEAQRATRTRLLYFFDTGVPKCGVSSQPRAKTRADLHTGTAAVNWPCATEAAMTHEMIHQFGVTHCDERRDQGNDPICRKRDVTPRCTDILAPVVLDCAKDEFAYFSPRPAPGSPLAEHPEENAANSPYLITDSPAPPVDIRLVGQRTSECLGLDDTGQAVHQACAGGEAQAWRRTIDDQGFLTLQHRADGKCLAAPTAGTPGKTAVRAEECTPRAQRQQWWMTSLDATPDQYQLINRRTGQRVQVPGNAANPGNVIQAATGGTAAVFRMEILTP